MSFGFGEKDLFWQVCCGTYKIYGEGMEGQFYKVLPVSPTDHFLNWKSIKNITSRNISVFPDIPECMGLKKGRVDRLRQKLRNTDFIFPFG